MSSKLWFKAKQYGWGWYPATWEGWLAIIIYITVLVWQFRSIDDVSHSGKDTLIGFVIPFLIITLLLLFVCYLKGEKPGWRWGNRIIKNEKLQIANHTEEMIDVLDEKGNKTGEISTRRAAHAKGLWHTGAHLYIHNSKKEVLLQLRSPTMGAYPNMWHTSVGGHVSSKETSLQTIIRETKEEIGLSLLPSEVVWIGRVKDQDILQNGAYINNEYDDVFIVDKDLEISKLKKQNSEVTNIAWIPLEEFKAKIEAHDPAFVDYAGLSLLFNYLEHHERS